MPTVASFSKAHIGPITRFASLYSRLQSRPKVTTKNSGAWPSAESYQDQKLYPNKNYSSDSSAHLRGGDGHIELQNHAEICAVKQQGGLEARGIIKSVSMHQESHLYSSS